MAHHHGHHHQEQEQMLREEQLLRQQQFWEWRAAMQAEHERLYAMPLADLATEVMIRAFGPGGPGYDDDAISAGRENRHAGPTALRISELFAPDHGYGWDERGPEDHDLRERIVKLVAEGLQVLEHASLVRCQSHTGTGTFDWAATRYGRAVLEQGQVPALLQGGRGTPGH